MQSIARQLSPVSSIHRASHIALRQAQRPCAYTRPSTPYLQQPKLLFSSYRARQQDFVGKAESAEDVPTAQKKKHVRSPAGKTSLRRVAVEAQRSRENATQPRPVEDAGDITQVTAITAADQFDMEAVAKLLRSHGFPLNPDETDFEPDQIIHTRGVNNGDIFVFPSGTLVAWGLPEDVVHDMATKTLLPAAIRPHINQLEMENLEYAEDDKKDSSGIKGDVITLGTKLNSALGKPK